MNLPNVFALCEESERSWLIESGENFERITEFMGIPSVEIEFCCRGLLLGAS